MMVGGRRRRCYLWVKLELAIIIFLLLLKPWWCVVHEIDSVSLDSNVRLCLAHERIPCKVRAWVWACVACAYKCEVHA